MEAKYLLVLSFICLSLGLVPVAIGQDPAIEIIPNITRSGEQINLRGYNLPSKQPYELRIDGAFFTSGTTLLNGTLNKDLTLPRTITVGVHTINLTSVDIFAVANFTIIPWTPNLSYSPPVVFPGMAIEIHGSGYPPNAALWIYIDGVQTVSEVSDQAGSFTKAYQLGKDISVGPHNITVNATQFSGPPSAMTILNITQWPVSVYVEPNQTNPGKSITVYGDDFPPYSLYQILFDGNTILNGQADQFGSFQNTYQIPPTTSLGQHVVYAMSTDFSGQPGDNDTVQLVQWPVQLSVDPPIAQSGNVVTLQGLGFPPNSPFRIYLDDVQVRFGTTNAQGQFQVQHTLDKTLSAGNHEFEATIPGFSGPPTAPAQIEIVPWVVSIDVLPDRPHPGESITINGSSFPPSSTCDIYVDDDLVMTLKADSQGDFLYQWQTPNSLALGTHNVSAIAVNYAGPPQDLDAFLTTQWPLSITPNTSNVVKGSILGLKGTGFPPNSLVRFYWDGTQYIKAGTADQGGNLSIDIFLNYPEDDSYHVLVVNVTDSYVGPPSTFTHVWLGQNPPNLTVGSLDDDHEPRNMFYSDEAIYVNGSGYPGLLSMTALIVDSRPVAGATLSPKGSVQITTDLVGGFPPTLIWPSNGIGEFYLVVDVNSNSIMDGIDPLMNGTLIRRQRPDVAVVDVQLDVDAPIQGELVTATFVIANEGSMAVNASIALALDTTNVWDGTIVGLTPGSTMIYNTTLDTGPLGLGPHNVTATVENLVDEIDILDNSLIVQFDVLSRPDIEATSIIPNSTSLIVGDVLGAIVIVENNGDRPESMEVDLLVDSTVVLTQTVQRLMPGTPHSLSFAWDTTSEVPRNISLSARARPLPFEQLTANNAITHGIISLSPPNAQPVADSNGPYTGLRGEAVLFDASASFDLDGEIVSYHWDFGDGTTGTGAMTSHVYEIGGSFRVTLNVTDDDGAWSTEVTNCRVTIPIYWLNVTIVDAISGNPISSAVVKIDGEAYPLVDGSISMEVESGGHRITVTAIDYIQTTIDIQLTGSISKLIEMNPICRIWPSDDKGTQMDSYSSDEIVYATVLSPGIYQSRIYVVSGSLPSDQNPIDDVTGDGHLNTGIGKGQTYSLVWPPDQRKGEFRLVLDLDSDGVFDSSHDRISSRFSIPEMIYLLGLSNFLAIIYKLVRGSKTSVQE